MKFFMSALTVILITMTNNAFELKAATIEQSMAAYMQIKETNANSFINSLYGIDRQNSGSTIRMGTYNPTDGTLALASGSRGSMAALKPSVRGKTVDRQFVIQSDLSLTIISFKDRFGNDFPLTYWDGNDFTDIGNAVATDGYYYYKVNMSGTPGSRVKITCTEEVATLKFFVERPNILFVLIDDYGVDIAPAPYKNSLNITTPNLDNFINNGTTFANCWVAPVCSPTRAAIMTGRYGHNNGVGTVIEDNEELSSSEFTLPQALALSEAGYNNSLIGKWHLGLMDTNYPAVLGWDHFSGILPGGSSYYLWDQYVNGFGPISMGNSNDDIESYTTTVFIDETIAWIEANKSQPWVNWLALNAPHTPIHIPPAELHTYDDAGADMNDTTVQFKATIESMDTELGRLITYLEEDGSLNNTLIIILGDNGTATAGYNSGAPQKGSLYEGGIKVPLVMWAGDSVANFQGGDGENTRLVTNVVNGVDIFTTITDLAGLNTDEIENVGNTLDGVSLAPYFLGDTDESGTPLSPAIRSIILSESFDNDGTTPSDDTKGKTVRNQNYKLMIFGDGSRELYKAGDSFGNIDETTELFGTDGSELTGEDLENYNQLSDYLEPIFNP
ncbi:MAG: sulfatase-like hydrolase/transferase [Lentisphaeraceae bacterium]|nr:sulfatase-like hydrolase/transferase [Lentisphaeraceae bacterium]